MDTKRQQSGNQPDTTKTSKAEPPAVDEVPALESILACEGCEEPQVAAKPEAKPEPATTTTPEATLGPRPRASLAGSRRWTERPCVSSLGAVHARRRREAPPIGSRRTKRAPQGARAEAHLTAFADAARANARARKRLATQL